MKLSKFLQERLPWIHPKAATPILGFIGQIGAMDRVAIVVGSMLGNRIGRQRLGEIDRIPYEHSCVSSHFF